MTKTETAKYTVHYFDVEYRSEQSKTYRTANAAASSAHDLAMEGNIVLRITKTAPKPHS